jgi:hypothetical protein
MNHIYLIWDENDRVVATFTSQKRLLDALTHWLEKRDDKTFIQNVPDKWDGRYHVLHLVNRNTNNFLTFSIGHELVNNGALLVSMKARAEKR